MVGVPRSKACISCRARRKGCDGKRPTCGQCIRRGVNCPGYRRELNIIFVHPQPKEALSSQSNARHDPRTIKKVPPDQRLVVASPRILPRSFLETACRSQIYSRFFEAYLPRSSGKWPKLQTNLNIPPSASWLDTAATASPTDDLLTNALTTLALSQNERSEGKDDRRHESSGLYGTAMRKLSKRLNDKEESFRDSTLAAVMALTMYEVHQGTMTRANGWLSHVRGATTLVRLRGAQNFSTTFSKKLFLGSRLTELINAIGERKGAPASATWPNLRPESQLPSYVQLFEILQALPAIIEQADQIFPNSTTSSDNTCNEQMSLFATMCQDMESKLWNWYKNLEKQQSQRETRGLFWPELSSLYLQLPPSSPSRMFPFFLCFPDLNIAEQVLLYWTGLLLMHRTVHYAEGRLRRNKSSTNTALYPPDHDRKAIQDNVHAIALKIASSLEYFVHPDMGLLETNFIGFPMNVALGYFSYYNMEECLWFEVIRARMRAMKSNLSDSLDEMAKSGGGVEAMRLLVP